MSIPEIQRVSMAQVVLQMKHLGVQDPSTFPYVSPPSTEGMKTALTLLLSLGALDNVSMT